MSLKDHPPVPGGRGGRGYRIDEILEELDEDDADALRSWLGDLRFSPERIANELRAEGFRISENSVASYRHKKLGLGERER